MPFRSFLLIDISLVLNLIFLPYKLFFLLIHTNLDQLLHFPIFFANCRSKYKCIKFINFPIYFFPASLRLVEDIFETTNKTTYALMNLKNIPHYFLKLFSFNFLEVQNLYYLWSKCKIIILSCWVLHLFSYYHHPS